MKHNKTKRSYTYSKNKLPKGYRAAVVLALTGEGISVKEWEITRALRGQLIDFEKSQKIVAAVKKAAAEHAAKLKKIKRLAVA